MTFIKKLHPNTVLEQKLHLILSKNWGDWTPRLDFKKKKNL